MRHLVFKTAEIKVFFYKTNNVFVVDGKESSATIFVVGDYYEMFTGFSAFDKKDEIAVIFDAYEDDVDDERTSFDEQIEKLFPKDAKALSDFFFDFICKLPIEVESYYDSNVVVPDEDKYGINADYVDDTV